MIAQNGDYPLDPQAVMAKKRFSHSAIAQADIQEHLNTQDDFALELFVFGEATKAGLQPAHGGSYVDPVTSKDRQFDIRASRQWRNRRISFAIECKTLRANFPVLVSRVPRTNLESYHCYVYSYWRPFTPGDATGESAPANCESIRPSAVYPAGDLVGKSITQVGRDSEGALTTSNEELFNKWSQAFASSAELVAATWKGFELSNSRALVSAVFPVLVVSDHMLWVADYGSDGRLQASPRLEETAHCFFGKPYPGPGRHEFRASHLSILTKSAVPEFFARIAHDESYWNSVFPPEKFPNGGALAHQT